MNKVELNGCKTCNKKEPISFKDNKAICKNCHTTYIPTCVYCSQDIDLNLFYCDFCGQDTIAYNTKIETSTMNKELEEQLTNIYINSVNTIFFLLLKQISINTNNEDSKQWIQEAYNTIPNLTYREFYSIANVIQMATYIDKITNYTYIEPNITNIVMLSYAQEDIIEPLQAYTHMLACIYLEAGQQYNCSIQLLQPYG